MSKKVTNIDTKLPAGWEIIEFSKIGNFVRGVNYKKESLLANDNGHCIKLLRANNIQDSLDLNDLQYLPIKSAKKEQILKENDILFCMSSGSKHLVGKNILLPKLDNYSFGAFCSIFRVDKNTNATLLSYFLKSNYYQNEINKFSQGTNILNLRTNQLEKILIPQPPLTEQNKIVSVLENTFSKIDKSIELVKENIEKIKQLNASVLDEVFEKLGSTNLKKLMDIADVKRGKSKHRPRNDRSLYDGKYPLVQTGDIRNCEKYLTKYSQTYNEKGLAQSKLWKKGTICLTIAANIGDVAILDFDACFPDSVLGIYSTTQNNNYLYYFLTSIKKKLDAKSSAAAQKNLSVEKLTDLYIPIPTLKTQEKIVDYLDKLYTNNAKLLSYYQTKLLSLQQLKNSVLESAFKGELRKDLKEKKTAKVVAMPVVKKASDKFIKIEIIYSSIYANKQDNIKQGEMAIAKDMYLIDRIGGVQTGFQFAQHNWGAFDPEAKQLIHTKQYFEKINYPNSKAFYYDVKDNGKLLEKIPSEIKQPIFEITNLLNQKIFAKYDAKQRPHKKELLATILKCIEDTQSTDFDTIRTEMKNWKTPKQEFKNKAEKFTPQETKDVLGYIVKERWDKKVINN